MQNEMVGFREVPSLTPAKRDDGIARQLQMQGFLPEPAVDFAFHAPIRKHEDVTAIRVGEGDVVNSWHSSGGGEYLRAAAHGARKVSQSPILSAARDLLRLRFQRHKAATLESSDVGSTGLIQNQFHATIERAQFFMIPVNVLDHVAQFEL